MDSGDMVHEVVARSAGGGGRAWGFALAVAAAVVVADAVRRALREGPSDDVVDLDLRLAMLEGEQQEHRRVVERGVAVLERALSEGRVR